MPDKMAEVSSSNNNNGTTESGGDGGTDGNNDTAASVVSYEQQKQASSMLCAAGNSIPGFGSSNRGTAAAGDGGGVGSPGRDKFASIRTTGTTAFDELKFVDHFSLGTPSSTIRFRGARLLVYEENGKQMILEDRVNLDDTNGDRRQHTITVKSMANAHTFGLRMLRLIYTLLALVMVGFLFVFCFQIILFTFVHLPSTSNANSYESKVQSFQLVGSILSIPLLLHAMGNIMVVGFAFIGDTWNGHTLLRSLLNWPIVAMEWLTFIFFLGIPLLTIIITLFTGNERWWEVSVGTWMLVVFAYFLFFVITIVVREFQACCDLVVIYDATKMEEQKQNGAKDSEINQDEVLYDSAPTSSDPYAGQSVWTRRLNIMKRAILISQTDHFSGIKQERYLVGKHDDYPTAGGYVNSDHEPVQSRSSIYGRLTSLSCLSCVFDKVDPPTKNYTVDEIRDTMNFITNTNWSLEAMYCRPTRAREIVTLRGQSALTNKQINSSFICLALGMTLTLLVVLAALIWMGNPATTSIIVGCIIIVCCIWPTFKSARNTYKTVKNLEGDIEQFDAANQDLEGEDGADTTKEDANTGLYQIWESLTVTRPKPWYCWARLGLDFLFLFLWPLITYYIVENTKIGTLFLICGIISFFRIYFDASSVLSELGSMEDVPYPNLIKHDEGNAARGSGSTGSWFSVITERTVGKMRRLGETENERVLLAKSRVTDIIGNISRSKSKGRWMWVFGIFAVMAALMIMSADDNSATDPQGNRPPLTQVTDFYYPPQPDLPYPTCEMAKQFTFPSGEKSPLQFLSDYSLFAAISYETKNIAQHVVDVRFGEGVVVDETDLVYEWRNKSGTESNPVFFKLFSFPDLPGYGVVAIRGSQTTWDFLVDAQLWAAALFAQIVRAITPLGWLFTPILDDLVTAVNWVESDSLNEVNYYKITTQFINELLEDNWSYNNKTFHTLRVTGASLGGGLAIISGAQTRANAVAISGLNGVLTRHSVTPQVTEEQLATRTFNVIPDRDFIARTGIRSRLFQEIDCKAPQNSFFGCHSMWRTQCELQYTCGTRDRAVMCQCYEKFGYPLPTPTNETTRTFEQACAEEEALLPDDF